MRDLAGAVPSEGCGACPSSPRKVLLVSSSSAHSGDLGPGLDSGSCDAEGPRGTRRGPRMSAMLKGVRGVPGSDPELMASGAVAVPPLAALGSAAAWALARLPIWAPRLGPAPRAGPDPRVPLLLRPHLPTPGRGGSGVGRCPDSGISRGRGDAERNPRKPGRRAALRCRAWSGVHSDLSWAAPRFCVPQTPRLAAALAHKLVGNKIALPGPNCWEFAKFRGGRQRADRARIPSLT